MDPAIPVRSVRRALKARKLLAEVEDRALRVAVKKGLFVPLDEVRQEWNASVISGAAP